MSSFSIHLSQEEFCDALRPVEIENDGSRSANDPMSPHEFSQARALVMKAQWRALQSAPQYSARVGIAASTLTNGKLQNLRDANALVREMWKSAKENLVFHNFNFGREKKFEHTDLIFAHWGDAGHNNGPTGGSTGGYVTGITIPQILEGKESPVTIEAGNFADLQEAPTAARHKASRKVKTKAGVAVCSLLYYMAMSLDEDKKIV